jgi:hypothetical protein
LNENECDWSDPSSAPDDKLVEAHLDATPNEVFEVDL